MIELKNINKIYKGSKYSVKDITGVIISSLKFSSSSSKTHLFKTEGFKEVSNHNLFLKIVFFYM